MEDWLPTIMSQRGQPDLKKQLLTSYKAGNRSYEKIRLDGYDQTPVITNLKLDLFERFHEALSSLTRK